eukprot:14440920-Alexandrium_andersonii.AAC.1
MSGLRLLRTVDVQGPRCALQAMVGFGLLLCFLRRYRRDHHHLHAQLETPFGTRLPSIPVKLSLPDSRSERTAAQHERLKSGGGQL